MVFGAYWTHFGPNFFVVSEAYFHYIAARRYSRPWGCANKNVDDELNRRRCWRNAILAAQTNQSSKRPELEKGVDVSHGGSLYADALDGPIFIPGV